MRAFSYELPDYTQPVAGATAFHNWLTGVSNATTAAVQWGDLLAHYLQTGSFAELMAAAGETSMALIPVSAPKEDVLAEVKTFRDYLVLEAGFHGDFANFVAWNFFPARHHPPFTLRMAPAKDLFLAAPDKSQYLSHARPGLDAALESRYAGIEAGSPRYTGQFISGELSLFLEHQGWDQTSVPGTPVSGQLFHAFTVSAPATDVMVLHIDAEVSDDPRDLFSVALIDKARALALGQGFDAFMVLGNTPLYITPSAGRGYTQIGAFSWNGVIYPALLPQEKVDFEDYMLGLSFSPAAGVPPTLDDRGGLMTRVCGVPIGTQILPARRIHLTGASVYAVVRANG